MVLFGAPFFPGGTVWRPDVSGLAGISRLWRWLAGWLVSSGTSASASPTPSAVRLGAVLLHQAFLANLRQMRNRVWACALVQELHSVDSLGWESTFDIT